MACTWTFASGNRRFVLFPPNQRQCSLRRCPGGDPRRHLTDEARAVSRPAVVLVLRQEPRRRQVHRGVQGRVPRLRQRGAPQVGMQTMKEQKTLDARNNKGLGRTVLLRDGRVCSRE